MSLQTKPDGLRDEGRDPALDRVYAESAREEPPVRLDAAIRAAARREVHSRPRRLGSLVRALRAPVAIAAVLVLSASLVMLMKEEKADRFYEAPAPAEPPSDVAEKAQADAALSPPASPTPKAAPRRSPEPASAPAPAAERKAPRMEDRQSRNDGPAHTVPPSPQPFPAPAPTGEERGRTELRLQQPEEKRLGAAREAESGQAASGRALDRSAGVAAPEAPPAKPLPQSDALAKQRVESDTGTRGSSEQLARPAPEVPTQAAPPPPPAKAAPRPQAKLAQSAKRAPTWSGFEREPPEQWLERIANLRRTGREADAREMLEEFRKRFPDYPLPAWLTQ